MGDGISALTVHLTTEEKSLRNLLKEFFHKPSEEEAELLRLIDLAILNRKGIHIEKGSG